MGLALSSEDSSCDTAAGRLLPVPWDVSSGWVDVLGGGKSLIKATRCCCAASLGGCWSKGVFVGCVAVSMEKEEHLGAGRRGEPERGPLSPRRG